MKMANMDDYFDVVIIGTGAAGLYCALNLPARYRILLLTKQKADESDSFLAQGGICMQHGEADYRPFFDDTMRAGHYENNPATVDLMIRSSNSIIRDLVRRGVRFARDDHGALRFTREGAHSRPRILFHEDITGHEITQTLLNEVLRFENIELREHTTLLDFFADASACGGVIAAGPDGEPRAIGAGAVVLACGGIGEHLARALQDAGWQGRYIHRAVRELCLPHATVPQIKQATGLDAAHLAEAVREADPKGEKTL